MDWSNTAADSRGPSRSATADLADFVAHHRVDDIALSAAVPAILDTLAVAIGGSPEPAPKLMHDALESVDPAGGATVPWSTKTFSRIDAALVFGTASHVLDYDDVSMLESVTRVHQFLRRSKPSNRGKRCRGIVLPRAS